MLTRKSLRPSAFFLHDDAHGRMREGKSANVSQVFFCPSGAFFITVSIAQQEGFELVAAGSEIPSGIGSSPAKVTHGFVPSIGKMHRSQLPGPKQTRQRQGIATVRLDLVARPLRNA
jgi:hypothetical protein